MDEAPVLMGALVAFVAERRPHHRFFLIQHGKLVGQVNVIACLG